MSPGLSTIVTDPQYATCPVLPKDMKPDEDNFDDTPSSERFDNYQQTGRRRLSESTVSPSDTSTGSSVESELSDEERLQIESSFRGLKTQMFVCNSLANLYVGKVSSRTQENNNINWELHYTGIPVIILDTGETRSRNKRKISILLAERGTSFTLWKDTIDNLSSYKVSGEGFHTMYLSSDHTTMIGLSFDNIESSKELWMHIEKLTSCPENICLSMPKSKKSASRSSSNLVSQHNQKMKFKLPDKSLISTPCCFQHITNVDITDRERYYSLQTMLPGDHVSIAASNHSSNTNNSHL
uniref:Misexpression suppressor of ras 3 n=1 Tax=Cacopsylla melanoneura TaxID=428564 RepID=A0A8D8Y9V7_9HEMI